MNATKHLHEMDLSEVYELREALEAAGECTQAIDEEIGILRERLRKGPTLKQGECLCNGRFFLLQEIGRGGFATVWRAHDRPRNTHVAIKVLHGDLAEDQTRRERLFRGAEKMGALQHPNIVRVHEAECHDQGFYFYVMEYIEGGDLHDAVRSGSLSHPQIFDIFESVASALAKAHEQDLVHRDVKPQNILLRRNGEVALTDFDLVKARDATGGTRTAALGSFLYAAPEQAEDGSRVSASADIYSLGMTLMFCLHGDVLPPEAIFAREEFVAALPCSRAIRRLVRCAIAIDPEQRPATMHDFLVQLGHARRHVTRRQFVAGGVAIGLGAGFLRTFGEAPLVESHSSRVEFVRIAGGRFVMGSPSDEKNRLATEGPQHEVVVGDFEIAKTPITNAQYARFLREVGAFPGTHEAPMPINWNRRDAVSSQHPVTGLSWHDVQQYCKWAGCRLPTEAQWEYACRAGTTTAYYFGDEEHDLKRSGWYLDNSGDRMHPVGQLPPNPWGLFDMYGNVWNWCEDTWTRDYGDAKHAEGHGLRTAPKGDSGRVIRGGSYHYREFPRSALRMWSPPGDCWHRVGFRPVRIS